MRPVEVYPPGQLTEPEPSSARLLKKRQKGMREQPVMELYGWSLFGS
jgi:hypothetical protein